ncbi:MAG: 1-hydroxycarotenoid 3,4-desaturase CrtD [Pseudomonadota bacterium]
MANATRSSRPRVAVIGAGMGGLAAAIDLARSGAEVTLLERASAPGGKMRQVEVAGRPIDGGPTVFTMRWVFEQLFKDAGARLEERLDLRPAEILARHAWIQGGRLDLHRDIEASIAAIAAFAGQREAEGYRAFCARGADIFQTLRPSFMTAQRPSPLQLIQRVGLRNLGSLRRTAPFTTLWTALAEHFKDPRLRQLFGRYATYVGSSPLAAPATLMLIAHVEQQGVWQVGGGMWQVAKALQTLAEEQGAEVRLGAEVAEIRSSGSRVSGLRLADGEAIAAEAVVFNGEPAALEQGLLGTAPRPAVKGPPRAERALSAVTWCMLAKTSGLELAHHTVFFGKDYPREFEAIFRRRTICEEPTVYICAQDRGEGMAPPDGAERLLLLVNAPPDGDLEAWAEGDHEALKAKVLAFLEACGLTIEEEASVTTGPGRFNQLFPASGGALYGRANHGSFASFDKPGAASRLRGLYLAGGSVHPGAGVPMATLSGRLAAQRVLNDLT